MTSRVGISKVLIPSSSFAMGVIPSIAPYILTSSTIAASDWTSSRLYCEYTASNGSNQVSMATYVSPHVGSPFYLNQPLSLSLVGVNQNMIVDMDLSTAAEVKVWFTEVGNTAAPGTINASLMLTHDRAMFINQQLPALTPITTQGDLIVGDAGGNAIRLGIGTASQVLTIANSTAVWADATGGGMTNPMTTLGDMIIGGASGVPARLAGGTNGYILRYTNATGPAWRELSGAGLLSARSAAAAIREGQTYWATDAAVGDELTMCVHQGSTVYAWITIPHDTTAGASTSMGHSWERPDPVVAGIGATFINTDDGGEYISSGTAATNGVPLSGWMRRLPSGMATTRAALVNSTTFMNAIATDKIVLAPYSTNNCTFALHYYWNGNTTTTPYNIDTLLNYGQNGNFADGGAAIYWQPGGTGPINLDLFTAGQPTHIVSGVSAVAGFHTLVFAPVSYGGNHYWRWSYDGSTTVDTPMTLPYVGPSSYNYFQVWGRGDNVAVFGGKGIDAAAWNSLLSNADMAILSNPPAGTYGLLETASTGPAVIRIEANRFDPRSGAAPNNGFPLQSIAIRGSEVPANVYAYTIKQNLP